MGDPDRSELVDRTDGARLAVRVWNPEARRTIVLSNGLGCPDLLLRHLVEDLGTDRRVVLWDYRGQGGSSPAPGAAPPTLGTLAADLAAVQRAAGAERAAHLGFGLGAAVVLEAARRAPAELEALILVAPPGPTRRRSLAEATEPGRDLLAAAAALGPLGAAAMRRLGLAAATADLAVSLAAVGATCDRRDLATCLESLAGRSIGAHLDLARAAAARPAEATCRGLTLPVLLVGGTKDPLCPEARLRRLHELVPRSELALLAGASHACLLELGPLVAARARRFLSERAG